MWGEPAGPVGTALARAPAPPLPPHQQCLADSYSSHSDGYNMLLTAVLLPSTCSPPDHLDDLRGREMKESPAQNLNDSDYFRQCSNSPLPFFLNISYTQGPPVGSGLSLPLWTHLPPSPPAPYICSSLVALAIRGTDTAGSSLTVLLIL